MSSLLQPKMERLLVPPAAVPSKNAAVREQLAAVTDLGRFRAKQSWNHANKAANNNSNNSSGNKPPAAIPATHHCLCLHPVQPLCAYILGSPPSESSNNNSSNSNSNTIHNQVVVVQNLVTGEIVWQWHWLDLAATVYGETDPKKLPAAAKALGQTVSLQFYDPTTLFWSRLFTERGCSSGRGQQRQQQRPEDDDHYHYQYHPNSWQTLALQTERRILLLNLRRGPASSTHVLATVASTAPKPSNNNNNSIAFLQPVLAHLCEKTLGGVPSSNCLAVSETCLLTGCADGSMKCFDWRGGSVTKKIKGLGKGDCVIQLLPANPYYSATTASSSSGSKQRILTVTKQGSVYLIELTFSSSNSNNNTTSYNSIDIQPPLARLQVTNSNNHDAAAHHTTLNMHEQCQISYDGHADKVYWTLYPKASQSSNNNNNNNIIEPPVVYMWNLKALQADFVKNRDTKSLFKPDPSMVLHVSAATAGDDAPQQQQQQPTSTALARRMSIATGLVHPAFGEEAVVCATVTGSGRWCLQAATALSTNTVSTVHATAVAASYIKDWIVAAVDSLEEPDVASVDLCVYGVVAQPLASRVVVATNWGLLVLSTSSPPPHHPRHVHLASAVGLLGSLGKAALWVHDADATVRYASLDPHTSATTTGGIVAAANWGARLDPQQQQLSHSVVLYESRPPLLQSLQQQQQQPNNTTNTTTTTTVEAIMNRWPFRLAPVLTPSPTGTYIAVVWPCEYRYEILHTASLLQPLGQQRAGGVAGGAAGTAANLPGAGGPGAGGGSTATATPVVVASGTGVADFAWVSDDDEFALLHAPDWMEVLQQCIPRATPTADGDMLLSPNLKMIGAGGKMLGAGVNLATSVTKGATGAVTKGATNAANMTVGVTTKAIRSGAKGVTKGVKKSFGLFGGKKKKGGGDEGSSIMTTEEDDDESSTATGSASITLPSAAELEALRASSANAAASAATLMRRVELKRLGALESSQSGKGGGGGAAAAGLPAATCVGLGDIALRGGGNRNPPTAIFGGPVLCVASRSEEDREGHAYFYARKRDEKAASYQSSGPTLPYPDLVTWDDDGRLCAIAVANRAAVYLLGDEGDFVLLGTVRVCSPSVPTAPITTAKFVHGALYCCTCDSVHCVLLGDLEGGICHLDSYLLASTDVPMIPESKAKSSGTTEPYISLAPTPVSIPLMQPSVLGYQSGSLLVSTLRGVYAIPLNSPLLRIGLLLASGQAERAVRWFDAVPNSDHEALANFLERRGKPDLALELPGLSLETIVDFSMRYGYADRLEEVVETFGVGGLRAIDMGRGVSTSPFGPDSNAHSVVVCVGAYLLSHGRFELARRLASECLHAGEEGKKDAFLLGTLLLQIDESDATRLIHRAVGDENSDDWLIGNFARDFVL